MLPWRLTVARIVLCVQVYMVENVCNFIYKLNVEVEITYTNLTCYIAKNWFSYSSPLGEGGWGRERDDGEEGGEGGGRKGEKDLDLSH